jgi:hypothetical protein
MSKRAPTIRPEGPKSGPRDARAERLSAALKANLRRRKAQARERAADVEATANPHALQDSASHDSARIAGDKRSG